MGVYDRDYYRKDESSNFLAGRSMMWNIIIATGIVFVVQMILKGPGAGQAGPGPVETWFALFNSYWQKPWEVWRLVSYGFLHGGLFHLIGNMIGLWCFGEQVEDRYGRNEFLRIYLAMLAFGAIAWLAFEQLTGGPPTYLVGASGACVGMILLGVLPDPKRELLLFGAARIPAWLFASLLIFSDLIGAYQRSGFVAHSVHLAGAAFAGAYFYFGWNLGTLMPAKVMKRLKQPKLRVLNPDEEDPRDLNKRVDEILAKISRTGEESLSNSERRTLEEASKRYQRRQRS